MTINKDRYIVVLHRSWRTLCARRGVNREEQWSQKYGATPHTASITMKWLHRRFAGRLISRRHIPEWSPDLN